MPLAVTPLGFSVSKIRVYGNSRKVFVNCFLRCFGDCRLNDARLIDKHAQE